MSMHSNSDPKELDKFSRGDWWNQEGDYRLLHQLNPIRLAFIQEHTSLALKKAVDLGCGGGILTEALAQKGADCTGVDLNETALEQATLHASSQKLTLHYQKAI